MIDTSRREAIRSQVAAKKAIAASLQEQFTDDRLKAEVQMVWNWLNDVEVRFLDQLDDRTPTQEARWLAYAELYFLQFAVPALAKLESYLITYGPNATEAG